MGDRPVTTPDPPPSSPLSPLAELGLDSLARQLADAADAARAAGAHAVTLAEAVESERLWRRWAKWAAVVLAAETALFGVFSFKVQESNRRILAKIEQATGPAAQQKSSAGIRAVVCEVRENAADVAAMATRRTFTLPASNTCPAYTPQLKQP